MHQVASFCGLRAALNLTACMTGLSFLILMLAGYRTATPLYITLACMVLPSLIHGAFYGQSDKKKEKEASLPFPLFRKKYHYVSTKHSAMRLGHLFVIIMFAAWHISFRGTDSPAYLTSIPGVFAILSLCIRLGVTVFYRIYFKQNPIKAMR